MKLFLICCFLFVEMVATSEEPMLKIESPAFKNKEKIPAKYTCEGEDHSPPLLIGNIPAKAKSIAIIIDDPDAPMGTFDHWVAWNLPSATTELAEGASAPSEGVNGFGATRYRGPCPPRGKPHRYFFKVYALDTMLDLAAGSTKAALENAMKGHILSQGELIGLYQR